VERASEWPLQADERLLRRFLAGEPAACRQVERWAHEILLFQRLGLTREERDDAVQDVLAGVWRAAGRPGFALRHGLRAFVRTVTLARAIDCVRRRRRTAPVDESLPDPAGGPAIDAEHAERSGRLHDALAALDPRCRAIIRLHYFEDWTYARIAALERRRESTMRVRMFNCLRALRQRLPAMPGSAEP
jgi:RNA polymerase sigma factor (sigma-70 family)